MLRNLTRHEKGMRWLIFYLFCFTVYLLFSSVYSFVQIVLPMMEINTPLSDSPDERNYLSLGEDRRSIWPLLATFLPLLIINAGLSGAGAIGLMLYRKWGWWLSSLHFTVSLLTGVPSLIYQFFFFKVPTIGDPLYARDAFRIFSSVFFVLIAIYAVMFLFRNEEMQSMHVVPEKKSNKIAALIGLSLLFYLIPLIPALFILIRGLF